MRLYRRAAPILARHQQLALLSVCDPPTASSHLPDYGNYEKSDVRVVGGTFFYYLCTVDLQSISVLHMRR